MGADTARRPDNRPTDPRIHIRPLDCGLKARSRRQSCIEQCGREVVEGSSGRTDRSAAVTVHIPCESKTRREIPPLPELAGVARESGIAVEVHARRCGCESVRAASPVSGFFIEIDGAPIHVNNGKVGLPAQTIVKRQSCVQLPCVRAVKPEILSCLFCCSENVPWENVDTCADKKVRHSQPCGLAVKGKLGPVPADRIRVHLPVRDLRRQSHLVISAKYAEVVVDRENGALGRQLLEPSGAIRLWRC